MEQREDGFPSSLFMRLSALAQLFLQYDHIHAWYTVIFKDGMRIMISKKTRDTMIKRKALPLVDPQGTVTGIRCAHQHGMEAGTRFIKEMADQLPSPALPLEAWAHRQIHKLTDAAAPVQ